MAAKAEYLRHFFLDQIVDNDLGTVEHIARRHRLSPYRFHNGRRSEDETRSRFYIDSRRRVRKYHAAIKKGSLTFSHTQGIKGDIATCPGRRPSMNRYSRRTILKNSAAFASASAIGFPAISYG